MIFNAMNRSPLGFFAMMIAVIFLFGFGLNFAIYKMSNETVTGIYVNDKERIVESDGNSTSSKYLVFTENETFENTDYLLTFKFNSSDIQGRIKPGQTCEFEVVGWRVSFMSMYRNILDAKCV